MFNPIPIPDMVKFTRLISVFLLFTFSEIASAQCPTADFSIVQPVCPQQLLNISNTSTGAVSAFWDFCAGDFYTGQYYDFDTLVPVTTASFAVPVIDGANHYGFICGRDGATITRLDFGSSFQNSPGINNLGNPLSALTSPNGMAFLQEGGTWYAIVVNIFENSAVLFTFGNGVGSAPTASSAITIPGLDWPRSLALTVEGGRVFAAIMNNHGDQLTIADFGPSITNASPTIGAYSVTGANAAMGVSFARSCNLSCVFVSSFNSGSLIRVEFGNTLQSAPTLITPLTYSLTTPSGVSIIREDGKWMAVVSGYNLGTITVLSLDTSLTTNTPTLVSSYHPNGSANLNGLTAIRENSDWFIAVADEATTKFFGAVPLNNCSANLQVSTDVAPANIQYNLDGTYHISLEVQDAQGNISMSSDSVSIAPAPVVSFTFENLCEGDVVQFYDSSTLSQGTITNRLWDFGDGDTSNLVNPTHQYTSNNTYNVTLTLTANSGCSTSLTQALTVSARPVANFTLPNGCSDALLAFTDQSTISSGTISNWLWTFGNGDSATTANPYYGFPDGGNFDVTLQVTSAAGCSDDSTFTLNISPSPDAAFVTSNTCVGQSVTFTDSTVSQVAVSSYSWDFGDATGTSNVASPTYTYASGVPATYTVTMIVTATNACSDTVTVPVHISNVPTASFTFPSNICQGNGVIFTDASAGNADTISGWLWDFGDSFTDTVMNPVHIFAASDTFHVTLIAYSPSSCPSAPYSQDIIVIQSPVANFSFNDVCLGDSIHFNDQSVAPNGSTIIDRFWSFDDGDTSHLTNPVHLFTTSGTHQVILTVTTNFGCTSSDTVDVAVHAHPVAAFAYQNACSDYPTIFTNNSTTSEGYIALYEWNFGDPGDSLNTSSIDNPTHTYDSASTGFHNVTLIVTNNFGCRDSILQTIDVNFSVIPNFSYSPTCLGDIMSFTNLSENANLAMDWTWNFGDQQTIGIENPAHYYVYAGTYTVTLTVMSTDSCVSSASKDVVVSGIPVADFTTPPACIHTPYQLTDNSTVSNGTITGWSWTIDTMAEDTLKNPSITFDTTGTFSVNLVVSSDIGCVDSVRKNVTVHPLPIPNFSYSPQYGNPPLDVTFTNLTDLLAQRTYVWDFGDNTSGSTLIAPHHLYQDTGRFVISLVATSDFGCVDSISKGIYVIRPVLDAAVTNVSATLINNQLSIQANIANLGTVDIDSVIMQAQLQDGTVIEEVYHHLLPNGSNGIQSYDFVARFNIPPSSSVDFYCVSVIRPNGKDDDVQSNNQKCSSLTNEFSIMEPFPNPFNDVLQMNAVLPYEDFLTVELYNNLGQKISTIFDGQGRAGLNLISTDFSSLSDGIYTLRFSFRDQDILRKVIKERLKK